MTDKEQALKALQIASESGINIRLSNKNSKLYWWCYMDDVIVQANTIEQAILDAFCKIKP